jgi:hypothetical protein
MATLHKQYIEFNTNICLKDTRVESLETSREDLKKKIKKWFSDEQPGELQPKFAGQGSFEMGTMVTPIAVEEPDGTKLFKYDLDYGIYFIEKDDEDNRKSIETWRDWVAEAVDGHTKTPPERHKACIRVIFADGHHVDLPIYYKKDDLIELAHRDDGWLESDPKAFYEWFNDGKSKQLERIVRYLKAWKNYRQNEDDSRMIPSGMCLSILAKNNLRSASNDDDAFRQTVEAIRDTLNATDGFKCLRPTTPKDEDLFENFTQSERDSFINELDSLVDACVKAKDENNQRTASDFLREHFGSRFPQADDVDEDVKSQSLAAAIGSSQVVPRPYYNG